MQKNLNLLLFVLFSVVITNFSIDKAYAFTPIVHLSPKPSWILPSKRYNQPPSARDVNNGAYDELIEEQVNVEQKATYNHIITQIVSQSGVQNNSDISVSFNPAYERLDFHEITVWRNNKPQSRLNVGEFKVLPDESEIEKFIYNGTYSAKYILSDIRKGDRLEYSYTITGFNPVFDNKFCRSIYLQGANRIEHQYTTLLFAAGRKLNLKSFNLRSQPKISVSAGIKRFEWEDFKVPGISTNKIQPDWFNQYARVQVSEFGSWKEVVNWGLKTNPLQTTFKGELADTIAKLKRQSGGDQAKYFRAAVTLVQDGIRYMGIETGPYSHKANMPENVFKQRYGDCKDKSLLLASILNANGIEAHLALINTDLEDKVESFMPSPILFNHAVVVAAVNGEKVWADATMANQGGKGTDLYFPPYREGLILSAGNTGLTKINETKTGSINCVENFDVHDEFTPVKLSVVTTYTRDEADDTRDHIATTGIAQTEKNYLDYYSKTFSKIEAGDSLIIKDNRAKNELTTIESYKIRDFFKHDAVSGKYTADFYADFVRHQLPDVDGEVHTPVLVNYPYNLDYTIHVFMAGGWDNITDEKYELNRSTYKFATDKKVKGDDLALHYQFTYLNDYVPLDKLPEFKQDIKDLKDDQLSYSFYYIPDIKKLPFKLNRIMFLLSIVVIILFAFLATKYYKTETREEIFANRVYSAPAIGGWLIVLLLVIFASAFRMTYHLVEDGYFGMSKWDLYTNGQKSLVYRLLLIFEMIGNVGLASFCCFCLLLIVKKRDIAPYFIKRLLLFSVLFIFCDYLLNAFFKAQLSNYDDEQIIQAVIMAAIWTYYLNISERVKSTFIVPYPH
ncbi:DUF3857 domain-containing protein [Mucilaginibacter gotjawali]|uniref:Uncharacterized protein n=2 Tax=Mucilaginibacter gotjawali TaxID=1550579 RepID=A0A120MZ20_9SPHI|nr:DUF3857 domain-containing protein [Mucilaginibacter gotjawali]MBB3055817.1 transglutaminase-like putative cysteine protease [Mucilaginibacter gotjawali]BAU54638.1 hypothetical protein MgSA37_02814 [Mucilaginibacter gotjawali]